MLIVVYCRYTENFLYMMDKLSEVDYVPNPQLAKVSFLLLSRLLLLFSTQKRHSVTPCVSLILCGSQLHHLLSIVAEILSGISYTGPRRPFHPPR